MMLSQRAPEPVAEIELFVILKATLSSAAATIADGIVYQLLLFALTEHYGLVPRQVRLRARSSTSRSIATTRSRARSSAPRRRRSATRRFRF
ncbi:MAG TPA: hypothetical protein VGC79_04675 [Polyangiaceae bacterium]